MTIKRVVAFIILFMMLFCIALLGLIYLIDANKNKLLDSYESRYESYLLADQLRQSSDDLTRFARTYVVTGDKKYKEFYFEVLAIRNGDKPRPKHYERIYWDLLANGFAPRQDGETKSLHKLMEEQGISQQEFTALETAENNSNELVKIETIAMNMVENRPYSSLDKNSTNYDLATMMMHDNKYHLEKYRIMKPVDEFFNLLNVRTRSAVDTFSKDGKFLFNVLIFMSLFLVLFTLTTSWALVRYILKPLGEEPQVLQDIAYQITKGNFHYSFKDKANGLYKSLSIMNKSLKKNRAKLEAQSWLQQGQALTDDVLRKEQNPNVLGRSVLSILANYSGAKIGSLYIWKKNVHDDGKGELQNISTFSYYDSMANKKNYQLGEGVIGQAAVDGEIIIYNDIPEDYMVVQSSIGESPVTHVVVIPFFYRNELKGVLELGFFTDVTDVKKEFFERIRESLGITFENILANQSLKNALDSSQTLSEELQTQQEELRISNDLLVKKTEELEDQKQSLQNSKIEIEKKAEQLENANRYKSEFLANMSHELRTPLNSLLILAGSLKENSSGHLDEEEVYSANTIEQSGKHLLALINDILDLSKIESGHMDITQEKVMLAEFKQCLEDRFSVIAKEKGIEFKFIINSNAPAYFISDRLKVEQILTNLIGNGLKFTNKGNVTVEVLSSTNELDQQQIHFNVKDTGIGIHKDKHEKIFNAFQQADSSMTRKYGGTGLGLSISTKLASLLNGEVELETIQGKGSTFRLVLPLVTSDLETNIVLNVEELKSDIISDTSNIQSQLDSFLVLVVGEPWTAEITASLILKNVNVDSAKDRMETTSALNNRRYDALVMNFVIDDETALDILPELSNSVSRALPPIIICSSSEFTDSQVFDINKYTNKIIMQSARFEERLNEELTSLMNEKATNQLFKPSYSVKNDVASESTSTENADYSALKGRTVLLVDDDMRNTFSLAKVLRNHDMSVEIALNSKQALVLLQESPKIDIVCLDIMMPENDGYHTLSNIRKQAKFKTLPIITLTANNFESDKQRCLAAGANDYLPKPIDVPLLLERMKRCLP
ncbi:response regulator [Parashewanella spongiae]|uniref:histidine kinase n=1 Tax=Parashewanella spongiae TaxID=342950 RepID=A0A3A6TM73_9GAMM|nr:response regulator [Parashewanella spongiae]MCL1079953.1 response regulator [Parashewanella spongiae]RJY06021.1 response regulator [Parashewanella spongiae]